MTSSIHPEWDAPDRGELAPAPLPARPGVAPWLLVPGAALLGFLATVVVSGLLQH